MSRTYRTSLDWRYHAFGRFWTFDELYDSGLMSGGARVPGPECRCHLAVYGLAVTAAPETESHWEWWTAGIRGEYWINRKSRDHKPNGNPPKWFKTMHRRRERARCRDAMNKGVDAPRVPKHDRWDWN